MDSPLNEREAARRRLMFVPGEDFYFLAYTTLILLTELKSVSEATALRDSRKIAYLADLLGSDSDLRLGITTTKLSAVGRSRLAVLYDRAAARHAPMERILTALTRRELISTARPSGEPDRVFLFGSGSDSVKSLLEKPIFDGERARLTRLRKSLPQLRTMTLSTVKERLFGEHGVHTWGD